MLKFVCEMPVSFDVEVGTAPLLETAAADEAPVAGCTAFVEGLTGAAGEPPIPCFCNSISTRFFSASNCCRLDTCARGCDADCAAAVAGVAAEAADAPSAASLAEGWIAPDQTWAPLPGNAAAACEPAAGAVGTVPAAVELPGATGLAPTVELPASETAAVAGAAARAAALAALAAAALTCATPLAAPTTAPAAAAFGAEADVTGAADGAADADPATGAEAASAPDASSAGIVSSAPTRIRLGS